ncbi:MAG: alanine dehydrogenase [Clostridia bacterium]
MIAGIGFPKMEKERGEKRDFLPHFFSRFVPYDTTICLEQGYGEKMGFTEEDYRQHHPRIQFVCKTEVYAQPLVVTVRSPEFDWIERMQPHAALLAMLHYETRPNLVNLLRSRQINAFSLDAIVDDRNQRMVVTYEMTAMAGVQTAFTEMNKLSRTSVSDKRPLRVTIIGLGNLGFNAGKYAFELFDRFRFREMGYEGLAVTYLDKTSTVYLETVATILNETDLLIDATKRFDATQVIIANKELEHLPMDAVILDLTADPYEVRETEVQGKAIEGIPHGNLDQYVFHPDQQEAYQSIPDMVDTRQRRTTISCNAWPGVLAKECMEEYGRKIWPFLLLMLTKGADYPFDLNAEDFYERALARCMISHYA